MAREPAQPLPPRTSPRLSWNSGSRCWVWMPCARGPKREMWMTETRDLEGGFKPFCAHFPVLTHLPHLHTTGTWGHTRIYLVSSTDTLPMTLSPPCLPRPTHLPVSSCCLAPIHPHPHKGVIPTDMCPPVPGQWSAPARKSRWCPSLPSSEFRDVMWVA